MPISCNSKEVTIQKIRAGEDFKLSAFDKFRDDEDVVLEAIKQNGFDLRYASDNLKSCRRFVLEAIRVGGGWVLKNASKELKADKGFALEAIRIHPFAFEYLTDSLRGDADVVLEAVRQDGWTLKYAAGQVISNKEVVLEACRPETSSIDYASRKIQDLCDGHDPVQVLEKAIAYEQLHAELPQKSVQTKKPVLKC